MDLVRYKSPFW